MNNLKQALFLYCLEQLERKRETFSEALQNIEADRSSETKSSAGDKYETSREMMRQEMDKLLDRIRAVELDQKILNALQEYKAVKAVTHGSLVKTDNGIFWIAISFGRTQMAEGVEVMVISSDSPIGAALMHKKVGDTASYNNKHFTIEEIC